MLLSRTKEDWMPAPVVAQQRDINIDTLWSAIRKGYLEQAVRRFGPGHAVLVNVAHPAYLRWEHKQYEKAAKKADPDRIDVRVGDDKYHRCLILGIESTTSNTALASPYVRRRPVKEEVPWVLHVRREADGQEFYPLLRAVRPSDRPKVERWRQTHSGAGKE